MEVVVKGSQKLLHHHIRNSLNTISSILGLQINALNSLTSYSDPKLILQSSRERIEVIAINNDSLCNNAIEGKVEFSRYVKELTDKINIIYDKDILVQVESEDMFLSVEKMFYIGFIISELFTNSIKYAYSNKLYAEQVKIYLSKNNSKYLLFYHECCNNKVPSKDLLKEQNLGFRLIKLIAKQLGGSFEITKNNGLLFILHF